MDIKTELKDDTLLFTSAKNPDAKAKMLNYLKGRGIITIEDLINCSSTFFRGNTKRKYMALIAVYRHEILGEPLITDVLLGKEYQYNTEGYFEFIKDIERLGLKSYAHGLLRKIHEVEYDLESKNRKISVEQSLRDGIIQAPGVDLAGYYLRYIEQKRKKEQQANIVLDDSATLSDLKKQFQSLLEMRDNLDAQIRTIQESIDSIERGENGNVRK